MRANASHLAHLDSNAERGRKLCSLEDFAHDVVCGITPRGAPVGCSRWGGMWSSSIDSYRVRAEGIEHGMFGIVYRRLAEDLAAWIGDRRVLEIMSGRGWLAHALRGVGVDVIATDDLSWQTEARWRGAQLYPVHAHDASDAVRAIPSAEVLLCQWPYMDPAFAQACAVWGGVRPIVYIGEGWGGCTADDSFFDGFESDDDVDIELLTWPGIHDTVKVGHWKGKA